MKATLPRADPTAVRYVVQRILNQGQVRWARHGIFRLDLCLCEIVSDLSPGLLQDLRPMGADVQKEELAEMVDKEMAATSTAIEDAVLRMDVSYTVLTLWLCSDSCHTCDVPCQKWKFALFL